MCIYGTRHFLVQYCIMLGIITRCIRYPVQLYCTLYKNTVTL